jgi:hypothetical protein
MKKNRNSVAEMIMLSNSTHNIRLADYIIKLTCKYYNIDDELLKMKTRKREICFPRQVAMQLIKTHTNYSLSAIGELFGKKDHATVLHACRTIVNLMDCDKQVKIDVTRLNKTIKLKSNALKKNIEIDEEFYYVDFNDYMSIKVKGNKGIMLSGFNADELHDFMELIQDKLEIRMHENTGFYILEQKRNDGNNTENHTLNLNTDKK